MKWTVRFQGGEELARQLEKLPFAMTRAVLIAALKAGAQPMRASAEQHAPRSGQSRFGHLQNNIIVQAVNRVGSVAGGRWEDRTGEAWVAVGPRNDYFYGLFQEYGTAHHGAQPFMRPAFDGEAMAALPIISQHLWAALRKELPASFPMGGSGNREVFREAA